jgi:hypothetical protein
MVTKKQAEFKRENRKRISGPKIEARIKKSGDWRGEFLSRIRVLMKQADPKIIEEAKWIKPTNPFGTPTWSHDGIVCTCETYKSHMRMTFANGASLNDHSNLFNSGFAGGTMRAIVFHEGDKINEKALKTLIQTAVAFNKANTK